MSISTDSFPLSLSQACQRQIMIYGVICNFLPFTKSLNVIIYIYWDCLMNDALYRRVHNFPDGFWSHNKLKKLY